MRPAAARAVAPVRGPAVLSDVPPILIDSRYCGPAGRANGGYLVGRLAARIGSPLTVALRRPVPLGVRLDIERTKTGFRLVEGAATLAEAGPAPFDLPVPPPPPWVEVLEATRRYAGFRQHPFPTCFVCGPGREPQDGLRIFAGPVRGARMVAAPWVPAASVAGPDGRVDPACLWAALDCPGAFAALLRADPRPRVLGTMTGHVTGEARAGDRCTVIAWPIAAEGRKQSVGTALIGPDGAILGSARAIWITVPDGDAPAR